MLDKIFAIQAACVHVRRFAASRTDGFSSYQNLPAEDYACAVNNLGAMVNRGLKEATLLRLQVVNLPPEEWLAKVGLSRLAFGQDIADRHTHLLLSVRDRCLLLVNGALRLGFQPRQCTPMNIGRSLRGCDLQAELAESLRQLDRVVVAIEDARNRHSHRGEPRSIASHGPLRRMEECLVAFDQSHVLPSDSITRSLDDLCAELDTEHSNTAKAVQQLSVALVPRYLEQIKALGGIAIPTSAEAQRAEEVMDYFAGGPKPKWMAVY